MWTRVCIGTILKRVLFPDFTGEKKRTFWLFVREGSFDVNWHFSDALLGNIQLKPKISGSWNSSPTARPWAQIKECGWAAGRWGYNKKPFLWPQWDELGTKLERQGGSTSQWGNQQKGNFSAFHWAGPFPLFSRPCWAPLIEECLSSQAFPPRFWVLPPERVLPQPAQRPPPPPPHPAGSCP